MKIYTNTFDLRQPTEKKFWVAPYSDFKIGIRVLGYNGTEMSYPPNDIELYKDGNKLTVDSNDGNMAYWKIKSEDTGEVEYTVKAKRNNKVVGELKLIQSVTDSTVYEQESDGEIPSDLEVDSIEVKNEITFTNNPTQMITSNGCAYLFNVDSILANFGNATANNATANNVTVYDNLTVPNANFSVSNTDNCPITKIGPVTIDGCTGKGIFSQLITNNLDVTGGCITVVNGNGINFVFSPVYVSELFGGCGGYVLAAFS